MTDFPGFEVRLHDGIPVLRLHYAADPAKRPGTPKGDHWLSEAERGYPGGRLGARWRKEMEIEYNALGGQAVFPEWETWQQWIVVPPMSVEGLRLYGSFDYGWRNPGCFLIAGVAADGDLFVLWETYARKVPVPQWARIIKGETVRWNGETYEGNPFAADGQPGVTWLRADPSLWAENQDMTDNTVKSIAELFRRHGVAMQPAERGGDTTIAEWLYGAYWSDPLHPRLRITTRCPNLIREIGGLKHKEVSARVGLRVDAPEAFLAKDDHAWDSLKYFLQKFPPGPGRIAATKQPGSFQWWKRITKAVNEGQPMPTFRREMV